MDDTERPIIHMGRREVAFRDAEGGGVAVTLDECLQAARGGNPLPALAWAMLYKLAAAGDAMERLVTMADDGNRRAAAALAANDPAKVMAGVAAQLRGMGVDLPDSIFGPHAGGQG